jgi:hypothetical protein
VTGGEVDPLLVDLIGPAAARALREHAGWKECDYDLELVFDSGRSAAVVAMVLEVDQLEERSTKLVLKTVGTAEEPIALGEFARHRHAVEKAPEDFGEVHLSALWRDPIRIGNGTWIVLQELVGDGDLEVEPLAVLLDHALGRAPGGTPRRPAVDIDADGFARTCGEVVEVILRKWVGHPYTPKEVGVTEFLGAHLGKHLTDPGRLLGHVREHPGRTIVLEPGSDPLPNPFALATGSFFSTEPRIRVFSGRSHGDLHSDNVLVVARPRVDSRKFFLIDLAGYEDDGPVTRDPVHFVLHLIAHNLHEVPKHQDKLIDLLLDPNDKLAPDLLPPWLVKTVTAVHSAGNRWAASNRMKKEWRTQTYLSLVGCALRCLGRKSTREEDKRWFLLLAAKAAAKFVSETDVEELPPPAAAAQPVQVSDPFESVLARAAFLRKTLHVPKVYQEVRRALVDDVVVPALLDGGELRVTTIRGDAGAGKSTIAGQVHDALVEQGALFPLVVPCQNINDIPVSVDGFDETVGELIGAGGSLTDLVRRLTDSGRRPVVLMDTVDNLLEQKSARVVVDLLARLIEAGAPVALTTRPFHYDAWIKPNEARLGGALAAPVAVPHLGREEVIALVSGYVGLHPSHNVSQPAEFAEHTWELAAERSAMQLIVKNPYLLLMLCETYAPGGTVPPDLTTSKLCDRYVDLRVYGSRRYPAGHEVLTAKRRLWQLVAGELWNRSKDRIALALPQSWLDDNTEDPDALQDLLSEEVLVKSPADPTSVQFNHQFLAEFSMAIHLRDHGVDVLHPLLDTMRGAPGARWFAWPVVRHVLARAHSTEDLDATLDRMDLAQGYAYQVAAQGLVEQAFPGYLAKLAVHVQNYPSLFWLRVLHFVDDAKVGEALELLATVIRQGDEDCASKASTVAGRLSARSVEVLSSNVGAILDLLDAVLAVREGRAAARSRDRSFPDQLLQNLLDPSIKRKIPLPDELLARTRSLIAKGTPVCVRAVIRVHLVPGVGEKARRDLLASVLSHRLANSIDEWGIELVRQVVRWDLRANAPDDERGQVEGGETGVDAHGVRPADFLYSGGKSAEQLRAAALAAAAEADVRLRPPVVELFVIAADRVQHKRVLICLQEVVKAGGQAWLLAELGKRTRQELDSSAPRLGALAKTIAAQVPDPRARHAWADWFAQFAPANSYRNVDGYLQLGWDHDGHRAAALKLFALLPEDKRGSVVANLAGTPAPGKDPVVRELLALLPAGVAPMLRVRVMDISGDHEPDGLVDMVTSPDPKASAQAMVKLEQAARAGRPWMMPELLDRFADSEDERVRAGILKTVGHLVRNRVGEVDVVVARWVGSTDRSTSDSWSGSSEEHLQLVQMSHSYLRHDYGSAPPALDAVSRYVDRLVTSDLPTEIRREVFALVKTAASREDEAMRESATRWIADLLDRIDIAVVREGRAFTKETLGKLLEKGQTTLADLTARSTGEPPGTALWASETLMVLVDLIVSRDEAGNRSTLLDVIAHAAGEGEVGAYIAAVRMREEP